MNEKEISELLRTKMREYYASWSEVKPTEKYLRTCDVIIYDDKIYFPHFTYDSMHTDIDLVLQNYHDASYTYLIEILKNIKLPLPICKVTDNVICGCKSDKFHFNYGSFSLYVTCAECGNTWEAYSE